MDMDIKMLVRLGAVALVGITAVVAVAEFGDRQPFEANSRRLGEQPTDPLGPMLMRCVELGDAAIRDAGCRKTWMENRRRFLGAGPRMQDKPAQPQGAASAPLPDAHETGVADDGIPGSGDKNAATPDAGKNNGRFPNHASENAAKLDAQPDGNPLKKPLADDQTEPE